LPTYRAICGYFNTYLHGLSPNHARCIIAGIIRDFPLEAKKDKFFYSLLGEDKEEVECLI